MNIDQIVEHPNAAHHYAERYVNFKECFKDKLIGGLKRSYSSYDGDESLKLAYLTIPRHKVELFKSPQLERRIDEYFFGNGMVRFPVHPQIMEEQEHIPTLLHDALGVEFVAATPTASMRTVFVRTPFDIYIKTHFPKRISSTRRNVGLIDIQRGMWISDQIARLQAQTPSTIGFLIDVAGIFFRPDQAGAILRDAGAITPEKGYVLPLASFFSPDKHRQKDPLLVEQLAGRHNQRVEEYLSQTLLPPYMEGWFWLMNEMGTVFTPHGQNALAEFDTRHSFVRYIHRDFQGKRVLPTVIRSKNLSPPSHSTGKEAALDESVHLSLVYDFMIGRVFFDRIIRELDARGYDSAAITSSIKDLFHTYDRNKDIRFHKTQVEYTFERGIREVKDTGELPRYR